MFSPKNIFVFLISLPSICLFIIMLNKLGIHNTLNLALSAALYGIFVTLYFKSTQVCFIIFGLFYSMLLSLSFTLDVFMMGFVSTLTLIIIKLFMPYLATVKLRHESNPQKIFHKFRISNLFSRH